MRHFAKWAFALLPNSLNVVPSWSFRPEIKPNIIVSILSSPDYTGRGNVSSTFVFRIVS